MGWEELRFGSIGRKLLLARWRRLSAARVRVSDPPSIGRAYEESGSRSTILLTLKEFRLLKHIIATNREFGGGHSLTKQLAVQGSVIEVSVEPNCSSVM